MSSKNSAPPELELFQALQKAEQALWEESLTIAPNDEYEITRRMAQEEYFHERRRELREQIAAHFDVPHEHLRTAELQGIQQGWPWEEP
jgi:L-fucose isomerase-like protein